MSELLDRETILELLRQLGQRLSDRGIHAELYVVGGTAMVLAYNRNRLTRYHAPSNSANDFADQTG